MSPVQNPSFLPNGYPRTGDEEVDRMTMLLPVKAGSSSDFAPKLTERQRRSAYAFHLRGLPRVAIALLFGINKRTVGHMVRESSPHYRAIRKEAERMGVNAFVREYLTDEDFKRMASVLTSDAYKKASTSTDDEFDDQQKRMAGAPNERAVRHAGVHSIVRPFTGKTHRVEIAWGTTHNESGCWHFRCLDPDEADLVLDRSWMLAEGDENTYTSTATHRWLLASSAW